MILTMTFEAARMNKPDGWHVPVHRENVPDIGLRLDLDADEGVRARLGAIAGVRNVSRLHASVALARHGDGLRATGRVTATVGQTCVVTLEPLENTVDEPFDVLFMPSEVVAGASAFPVPAAEEVDDTRETLVNGTADIGAVAAEFFLLGIDRYPRKLGAVFNLPAEDRTGENPFAVLAKLKSTGDKG
jgi:uncharacterized metal-binding protein YceD (DUF177 family)